MTRKEQIEKAAIDFAKPILGYTDEYEEDCFIFKKGAEWADSNPNWHKYPDEKPGGYDEALPDYFLCIVEYKCADNRTARQISIMTYISGYWWYYENDLSPTAGKVIAWMKLPTYDKI